MLSAPEHVIAQCSMELGFCRWAVKIQLGSLLSSVTFVERWGRRKGCCQAVTSAVLYDRSSRCSWTHLDTRKTIAADSWYLHTPVNHSLFPGKRTADACFDQRRRGSLKWMLTNMSRVLWSHLLTEDEREVLLEVLKVHYEVALCHTEVCHQVRHMVFMWS